MTRRNLSTILGALIVSVAFCASIGVSPASASGPSTGPLYAWGSDAYGELGDGSTLTQQDSPEAITLASGVTPTAIAAGLLDSLAIGSDGNLYAWGWNNYGQLGDGTTTNHDSPEVITLATGVTPTAIAAGWEYSLAIGSDGKLYAWGNNAQGQLGDDTTIPHDSPEVVTLASGVTPTAIAAAGDGNSLAIGSDGKLYAWGFGVEVPEVITLATGVTPTAIAAGGGSSPDSLAIGSDGKLYAWGSNSVGQAGVGNTNPYVESPVAVTLGSGVTPTAIAAGGYHGLAIGSDGNLYAWGDNAYGELGDGTATNQDSPEVITLASGVSPTTISAGLDNSLAIGSDGNLYAWGDNAQGQLGDGTATNHDSPEVITLASGVTLSAIAAGGYHGLAIGSAVPPASTPETPEVIALPIIAAALFAGVWALPRRRRSRAVGAR